MDDIKLDPTTGLPELPDPDMFWRVDRGRNFVSWGYTRVSIMKTSIQKIEVPRWNIFGVLPIGSVYLDKEITETIYYLHIIGENMEYPKLRPSKENVLATAIQVFKDYMAREESNALYGDYPPKSLVESEES